MVLSVLSSTPSTAISDASSELSYYTAAPSPNAGDEDVTNLSSPGEAAVTPYRTAKQLPDELKEHVKIWLEEKMYTDGIQLLESLLAPGGSRDGTTASAACVPPANLLAVLNTLAIHPYNTNRPTERKSPLIAARAMRYLRSLLTVVGPVNANLRSAFQFKQKLRGGRHNYGADTDSGDDEYSNDDESLRSTFAHKEAIWTRGGNFWKVAGWAFTCSALHPNRWRYWKPWLEYMVDVLQEDFDERQRLDKEACERDGNSSDFDHPLLKDSLIFAYVDRMNRMELRNMMKALFADGSQSDISCFPEVFQKETKSASRATNKRKRDDLVLDLENDKFGDYCDDSTPPSSQGSQTPVLPQSTARGKRKAAARSQSAPAVGPGFAESIPLRLRLFHLLASASLALPGEFTGLYNIYEMFSDGLRDLSAPVFALYISSTSSPLLDESLCSLLKYLLGFYLPARAPKPESVDKATDDKDGVSVKMLERCFLPFAANDVTVNTNAKMSLLLESLLRLVWVVGGIEWSESLQSAVEMGVRARNDRTKPRRAPRANADGGEDPTRAVLAKSGQRLLAIMTVIKSDHEEGNGS